MELNQEITLLFTNIMEVIKTNNFDETPKILEQQQKALDHIAECRKSQIKRIKKKKTGTKNSVLFLQLLNEIKNFLLHTVNLLKSQRDFVINQKDIGGKR